MSGCLHYREVLDSFEYDNKVEFKVKNQSSCLSHLTGILIFSSYEPFLLRPQASMSLSPEQSPAPCSLSPAFPSASKPSHTGGINVNAAPFQSVQAVCLYFVGNYQVFWNWNIILPQTDKKLFFPSSGI